MKKILFLSSAFIMTTLGAYAADGIITGGAGTCTVDVLGVSDNNATANTIATWSLNNYECGAGQYLDEDTLTCTTCPAGSYCPGGTFTIETASSGTFDCPAGYTESAAGAGTNNECYTACTVANANIEHATAVSGNDYYGTTDADTCIPTNCELGYHVDGGGIELVEKDPLIPVDYTLVGNDHAFIAQGGTADSNDTAFGLSAQNTWATEFDYGVVYGKASCQPKADAGNEYIHSNILGIFGGTIPMETVRSELEIRVGASKAEVYMGYLEVLLAVGEGVSEEELITAFKKYYAVGIATDVNYTTDSSGQYCYCQMDGFTPTGGTKEIVTSAPWVFDYDVDSADDCASYCATHCAGNLQNVGVNTLAFRAALFGALEAVETSGMCKITENNCLAGQYLAVVGDAMMCVPCKSGSYCPGGVYTIESENKGTNVCPTTHPNSDAGAGADTQCYTACTLETANIAHATAVAGNDYYGTGTDTCTATACATGYHPKGEIQFVEKTPVVNVDPSSINGTALIDGTGWAYNENLPNSGLVENNTIAVSFTNGILYGRASCQPSADLASLYFMSGLEDVMNGDKSIEELRSEFEPIIGVVKTDFAIDLLNRVQSGDMSMDEAELKFIAVFLSDKNANYSTSSTGQYCYFQVNGFASSVDTKSDIVGLPWMLYPEPFESADECASNCIMSGAEFAANIAAPVTLGALDYVETSICAANTINIDWNPDNGGAHTQNMCTYDGAITLPDEPVKVGYTFSGWKLVEPNSTPVQ